MTEQHVSFSQSFLWCHQRKNDHESEIITLTRLLWRNHIITPCNSISSDSCAVPCRRESRIMHGKLHMYSKRHRLNACSNTRDTYTRKKKMVGQKRQESVCGPKKIDCDMYSNTHRLKVLHLPVTHSHARSIKMRQNKRGSCVADQKKMYAAQKNRLWHVFK